MMKRLFCIYLFLGSIGFSFAQERLVLESVLAMDDVSWDIWGYYDAVNRKEYALVGSNGITIVDITDAKNPFVVSNIEGVADFDHKVWKNYIYTVSGSGTNDSYGHIIDISDVKNSVVVDSFPSAHNLFIDENGFMYASNPGVIIYDLNNTPTKPDSLSKVGTEGHDVTVVDDVMYDFHGRYGTNIYDVSDKKSPKLLSFIDDPTIEYHHQGWVSENGKYLYICDELAEGTTADISIWDITNLDDPERVGEWSDNSATVHNIFVINDWAYTSYYAAGIRIFDLSNPKELVLTNEYDTTPNLDEEGYEGVFGIYPFRNNKLLVSERKKGLYIFSFDSTRVKKEVEIDFEWSILPTITNDNISVEIRKGTMNIVDDYFTLEIYNLLGEIVFKDSFVLKDIFQKKYPLKYLQNGFYFVSLKNSVLEKKIRLMKY